MKNFTVKELKKILDSISNDNAIVTVEVNDIEHTYEFAGIGLFPNKSNCKEVCIFTERKDI